MMIKQEKKDKKKGGSLKEHCLTRTMTDYVRDMDEEVLAKAIKTLLVKDKNKYLH